MGKWATLGAAVNVSTQSKLLTKQKTNKNWNRILVPVKASKILSKSKLNNKHVQNGHILKPNPPFKKESWKKANDCYKTDPMQSNSNGILKKDSLKKNSLTKKRVSISEKTTTFKQIPSKQGTPKSSMPPKNSKKETYSSVENNVQCMVCFHLWEKSFCF